VKPEEIKYIRKRFRWSQERLARELGLSFSTISRWERGQSSPSPAAERLFSELTRSLLPKPKALRSGLVSADRINISGVVGLFSGPKDLSVNHDQYLVGSRKRR
jgi:transcriptional regulator with XRE-family HTH domain